MFTISTLYNCNLAVFSKYSCYTHSTALTSYVLETLIHLQARRKQNEIFCSGLVKCIYSVEYRIAGKFGIYYFYHYSKVNANYKN